MQRWNLLFILIFATEGVHFTISKISTAKELQEFSNKVNDGTTYNGTTVELTEDIDLSGTNFTRIGYYINDNPKGSTDFRGVFNGNGYLIKNMNLTSSDERFLGLFGYSNGGTFQNIVIDSSCSVTNMMDPNVSYAAGIVAYANGGGDGATKISNCVSMATITGTGTKTRLGGIAGVLYAYSKEASITDCVNLGNIVHSGTGEEIYAGGLVGWLTGKDNNKVSVSNCMNLGFVTSSPQNTGGIAGYSNMSMFTVNNNYWMEGTSSKGCSGPVTESGNQQFNSSDNSIIDKFNKIVPSISNKLTWYTITFDSNEGSQVESMLAMKVLIGKPGTPTKTGHTFDGWYMNSSLTAKWDQSTEFSGNSTLYAKWTPINYTISIMNESNEFVTNITGPYGTNVTLPGPNSTKEGYSFGGWLDATKNITYMNTINVSGDAQLQESWLLNAYQVKFDYGNGTISTPFYVYYESEVREPEYTARIGYTFDGWFKDKDFNEPVLFPMKMKANNITFYAKWIEQSEYVKIIFGSSNLTQEEALALIHKYTDDTFVVIKFEGDKDTNEAYIIVKFNDVSTASKVYERFQNDSDDDNLVTGIEFMTQYVSISFSQDFFMHHFITFIYLIMNIVLIVDF